MGLFDSLFGSKNKTKTSSQVDPWDEATKYLLGNDTTKGIFPSAQGQFATGGFTPEMDAARSSYLGALNQRQSNFQPLDMSGFNAAGNDLLGAGYQVARGAYDTNYKPVDGINIPQTNLVQARAGQGSLDPTRAMQRMLSGRPDNPYLDQQASAITNQLTRNLNENVMPGVRSEALASGQYGGSRQGIAEGLAASRLNQDLAPALTGLYGGAFENAQNRMFGTASQLNDQAYQNAANNAAMSMQGQQFNANLGLQNNQQQMGQNTQNLDNRMKSINIANGGIGLLTGANQAMAGNSMLQDNNFSQQMSALGMPQDINWQNLNNYAGIMFPGAQLGNQSQGKNVQTSTPGIVPAVMGTLTGIAGMASGMGGLGALGGASGGFSSASRGFMGGARPMFS